MNNQALAIKADQFTDHGHDHIGFDRGAEHHPILGYNFRISELHAAVGLAQFRRLDEFLQLQKKHHGILKNALSEIKEVSFRRIPDPDGDSYSFLNFFLPTAELSKKVMAAFKTFGVDSCWNYYENNWHYVRKWEHLKELKSANPLSRDISEGLRKIASSSYVQSDDFISRNISCLIKIGWTEDQVKERALNMAKAIQSVINQK